VDRFGHVRVLTLTAIGAAAALLAAGFATSLPGLALPLVAFGLLTAAIQTSTMSLMARTVSPERRGAVLGQVLFPFYLSGLVGPPIGAFVFPAGQPALFGLAAVASLAPLVLLRVGRRAAT
jgi:MFS family permease